MKDYSSVDTLLNQSRLTILQSVQALIEVQDFLQFITGDGEWSFILSLTNFSHFQARHGMMNDIF